MIKLVCLLILVCVPIVHSQTLTEFITVDQFGYRPQAAKVAVIRDPVIGFDSSLSFTPGSQYAVVNSSTGAVVFRGAPQVWNGGAVDSSSGDRAWWFDFTDVSSEGDFYILDVDRNLRSHTFEISESVYEVVLRHAMRTFFYQRAGFEKSAQYAGAAWADGASHLGPGQDANARFVHDRNNPLTERDLRGGWYDAGDFNKYTAWTANYVIGFLHAFQENPAAWGDNYNIPESGNGVPDILDEAMFGMDWLLRMQNRDGSVLSVMGVAHASPPSAATEPSLYGPPNTIATRKTAAAFALGATILRNSGLSQLRQYADTLQARALAAWLWAEQNPDSIFSNSGLLAAGNQETDDDGRLAARLEAAVFLFELTGDPQYRTIFDNNFRNLPLFMWNNFVDQYRFSHQSMLKYYSALPGATPSVVTSIRNALMIGYNGSANYIGALNSQVDPYRAFIDHYNWGSNAYKSTYGITFWQLHRYNFEPANSAAFLRAAESYLHYIHGVNPLGLVYLTNMNNYGADKSITQIFHSWFRHGSPRWDAVGVSEFGPPPGFLAGGPNDRYNWDACCPSGCGSAANNALCFEESIEPPRNQPRQKSYKDFNTSWPLNSWEITENSCGYQVDYIRLLSKFVGNGSISSLNPQRARDEHRAFFANSTVSLRKNTLVIDLPDNVMVGMPVRIQVISPSGERLYSADLINARPGRNEVVVPSLNNFSGMAFVKMNAGGKEFFNRPVFVESSGR